MRNINSRTDSNTPLENGVLVIGAGVRIVSVFGRPACKRSYDLAFVAKSRY